MYSLFVLTYAPARAASARARARTIALLWPIHWSRRRGGSTVAAAAGARRGQLARAQTTTHHIEEKYIQAQQAAIDEVSGSAQNDVLQQSTARCYRRRWVRPREKNNTRAQSRGPALAPRISSAGGTHGRCKPVSGVDECVMSASA